MTRDSIKILSHFLTVGSLIFCGCSMFTASQKLENKEKDLPFAARVADTPRKRLLILPFLDVDSGRKSKVAELARATLLRSLAKTDRFVFVHPGDLPQDAAQFVINNEYNMSELAKVAEASGIAALIEGKILDVKAQKTGDEVGLFRRLTAKMDATVSLKMFSVKGNREILSQVKSASAEGATTRFADRDPTSILFELDEGLMTDVIVKAFQSSIPQIVQAVDKLSWEGRVAVIEGPRIYLNAGRLSGLNVGDVLKVTAKGESIYDPETGDFIGMAPGRMKGTVEVVSYFGRDGAICVVHSGSGFRENDFVELY